MKYVKLGRSGLEVSRICLGCMSYGYSGASRAWALTEEESRPFIRAALDKGINFFDVANVYSEGECERVVGRLLREMANRDDYVIATKVHGIMRPGPNGRGLSRKAIMTEIDHSLERLGLDYVDLYIIHRLDHDTPLEETLEALNDVVRAGKARYLGASSMHAWELMKAIGIQRARGWASFISMQNYYNLMYREEEREMLPMCRSEGVGVTPWSPLARGWLTRPWPDQQPPSKRARDDPPAAKVISPDNAGIDKPVVERLLEASARLALPPARVALAWLLRQPAVAAPVTGATKLRHLEDAVAAVDVKLSDADAASLEEVYKPHQPTRAFV